MPDTSLYEAMSTLRAVRRLRPDPIADDVMERVLQAAAWAPSGGNQQPWRVVVVTDPALKQGLADLYAPEWARFAIGYEERGADLSADEKAALMRTLDAGNHLAAHLHEAPAILVFCFDVRRMAITDAGLDRVSVIGGASIYPAVQNLMLACVAEGLGCTLTTLHCLREAEVKELLEIREPWATAAMVPIGYPVGRGHGPTTTAPATSTTTATAINRRDPGELAYRNRFGIAWR